MKYDFAVLGANGMQGKIAARDLLENGHSVLLCANDDFRLGKLLKDKRAAFALIDLQKMGPVKRLIKESGASVVINCAIADFNMAVTEMCLALGVNFLDMGSYEKVTHKQFALDNAFKKKDIIGITGVGSTPGINNVMLRYARPKFDSIHTVHLGYAWKSNMPVFVPPFSIAAIAWEFSAETPKILENGRFVEKRPTDCKFDYNYRGIGRQKTYYTAHSEYPTMYKYLKDMGIRNIAVCLSFPKHSRETMEKLIELGFTKWDDPVKVDGRMIDPIDFTEALLRRLPIPKGYKERENIWIKIFGAKDGKKKRIDMDMIVETLSGWEDATCNIDTGMPASIMAQMIKDGRIAEHGVFSPEFVVPPEPFFEELAKRKILIYENGKLVTGSK